MPAVIDEPALIDERPVTEPLRQEQLDETAEAVPVPVVIDERPVTEPLRQEQLDETAEAVPVPGTAGPKQSIENVEEIVTTV